MAEVYVEKGDRIGWTGEADSGPISFDYSTKHFTYFRRIEDNKYPVVDAIYEFDGKHFPSIFSVGVIVNENGKTDPPTHMSCFYYYSNET